MKNHDADHASTTSSPATAPRRTPPAYVVAPITALIEQRLREGRHRERSSSRSSRPKSRKTATLERVWIDDPRPRAGRTVPLKVLLRTYRGEDVLRTMPIDDPGERAAATSRSWCPTASASTQAEQREARLPQPRSVPQLVRALNKARRNNTLYVKLLGSDAGAVVNGELLSSLPPSVLAVLESDRSGGNFNPLGKRHARRMGAADRARRQRRPDAHGAGLLELTRPRALHPDDSRMATLLIAGAAGAGRRRCSSHARPSRCTASSPKFFQAATQADFLKGDVENLSVDSRGQLLARPGDRARLRDAVAVPLDGRPGARRLALRRHRQRRPRVPGRSAGAKARRSSTPPSSKSTRWRSRQTAASTSAARPTGRSTRSIATAPRRRSSIRRRSTSGRWPPTPRATCTPAPARRASSTGSRPTARATPFYRRRRRTRRRWRSTSPATCSSAPNRPAACCASTPGRKGFVLLDSPFQEIRALRFDDKGMLYVAAVNGRAEQRRRAGDARRLADTGSPAARSPERRRCPSVSVSTEITCGRRRLAGIVVRHRARATIDRRTAKGAVYRIAPDGLWDQLWESRDDSPYDLAFDAERPADRRHRQQGQDLPARRRPAAADAARARRRQQVTALYTRRARPAVLRDRQSRKAVPPVARARAEGHLRVGGARRADGVDVGRDQLARQRRRRQHAIEVFTRSGNTETPDETWSPWSAAYTAPSGSPITSPKARYLQWRVAL